MSKPSDGSNTPKPDPFAIDSDADKAWWDYVMDHKGFNTMFRVSKDNCIAVSIYPNVLDH